MLTSDFSCLAQSPDIRSCTDFTNDVQKCFNKERRLIFGFCLIVFIHIPIKTRFDLNVFAMVEKIFNHAPDCRY